MLSCTFSVWRIIIIELVACVNCRDYDIPTQLLEGPIIKNSMYVLVCMVKAQLLYMNMKQRRMHLK